MDGDSHAFVPLHSFTFTRLTSWLGWHNFRGVLETARSLLTIAFVSVIDFPRRACLRLGCFEDWSNTMDDQQILIEAWKQTIAVQMHFNDIAMKIRAFALTLVAAILTAQSFAAVRIIWLPIVAALGCWVQCCTLQTWSCTRCNWDWS